MASDYGDVVVQVGMTFIAIVIMAVVAGQVVGAGLDLTGAERQSTEIETFGDRGELPYQASNITVEQSLGDAVAFDGSSDSELSTGGAISVSGDSEVCTFVRVDASATGSNQTVATVDGELFLRYGGGANNTTWVGEYYNRSDRTTYDITTNAPAPTDWHHLCLRVAGDTLSLAVNATDTVSTTMTGSHALDAGTYNYSTLDGRVDETRVYNSSLNSSQRTNLYDHPTRPLDGGAQARVMYDTFASNPDTLPIYFTGESGDVQNATLVASAFQGETVTEGDDYNLDFVNDEISLLDGGELEGAPAVFIRFDGPTGPFVAVFQALSSIGGTALVLLTTGLLLVGMRTIGGVFDDGF